MSDTRIIKMRLLKEGRDELKDASQNLIEENLSSKNRINKLEIQFDKKANKKRRTKRIERKLDFLTDKININKMFILKNKYKLEDLQIKINNTDKRINDL